MKHSLVRWLIVSAMVGFVVPLALLAIQNFVAGHTQLTSDIRYPLHRVMRAVWPSSVWLMATGGIEGTLRDYWFVSISVVANVLVYSALGCLLWWLDNMKDARKVHH